MEGFNIRVDLGLIQVYMRFAEVKQRKEGILDRMNCFREVQVTLRRDWVNQLSKSKECTWKLVKIRPNFGLHQNVADEFQSEGEIESQFSNVFLLFCYKPGTILCEKGVSYLKIQLFLKFDYYVHIFILESLCI